MKRKREKGYWLKKKEKFSNATKASERAAGLRDHEHTSHVKVQKDHNSFAVVYSVAAWYFEELKKIGISL